MNTNEGNGGEGETITTGTPAAQPTPPAAQPTPPAVHPPAAPILPHRKITVEVSSLSKAVNLTCHRTRVIRLRVGNAVNARLTPSELRQIIALGHKALPEADEMVSGVELAGGATMVNGCVVHPGVVRGKDGKRVGPGGEVLDGLEDRPTGYMWPVGGGGGGKGSGKGKGSKGSESRRWGTWGGASDELPAPVPVVKVEEGKGTGTKASK